MAPRILMAAAPLKHNISGMEFVCLSGFISKAISMSNLTKIMLGRQTWKKLQAVLTDILSEIPLF